MVLAWLYVSNHDGASLESRAFLCPKTSSDRLQHTAFLMTCFMGSPFLGVTVAILESFPANLLSSIRQDNKEYV